MNFKDSLNSFMHTLPVIMGTFIVIRFDSETIYILYALTRFVRSPVDYSVQSSWVIFHSKKICHDNGDMCVLKQLDSTKRPHQPMNLDDIYL